MVKVKVKNNDTETDPCLIKKRIGDVKIVAIMYAKDWFSQAMPLIWPVRSEDFVVCKWFDYHDGFKSNMEGKTTIAICREKSDAKILFKANCK